MFEESLIFDFGDFVVAQPQIGDVSRNVRRNFGQFLAGTVDDCSGTFAIIRTVFVFAALTGPVTRYVSVKALFQLSCGAIN